MNTNIIYFDNAATTYPKPDVVYKECMEIYKMIGVNPGRGIHRLSNSAFEIVAETRDLLSTIFKSHSDKIHFTPSVTFSLNQIIKGLEIKNYSTILISPFEHNAVYRSVNHIASIHKSDIEYLSFDKFTMNDISSSPDVLVITHQSNVTGFILPINEICKKIKSLNPDCITIIDGAQCGGYYSIDWRYIDFYCFSGHKSLYAPSGIAGFINNSNIEITPLLLGGTGVNSESEVMPNEGHERYEAGSLNLLSIIGLNLSIKWLLEIGVSSIMEKCSELTNLLLENKTDKLIIHRDAQQKFSNTVSFNIHGIPPQDVEIKLSTKGFALRSGLHCSPLTHKHIGTFQNGGSVRFSPGYFNSEDEVLRLLDTLGQI